MSVISFLLASSFDWFALWVYVSFSGELCLILGRMTEARLLVPEAAETVCSARMVFL